VNKFSITIVLEHNWHNWLMFPLFIKFGYQFFDKIHSPCFNVYVANYFVTKLNKILKVARQNVIL